MKRRIIGLLLILVAGALNAQTTISWGTGFVVDEMVQSDGVSEVSLANGFSIQLGTFGAFNPTANNVDQWAANWTVIDAISASDSDNRDYFFDFAGTDAAFMGGDVINANQTSASSDATGGAIAEGSQIYVWTFNTQALTEETEWSLYTQLLDGSCGNCIDGAWQAPDATSTSVPPNYYLSEADTALFGAINDGASIGDGFISESPETMHLQTGSLGRGNYWDLNGSTVGSAAGGTTATWNSSNKYWNSSPNGTNNTKKFKNNAVAVFSAGTDAAGSTYTVTKVGNEDVFGLDFEDGDVTIAHGSGGSITFDRNGHNAVHEVDGVNTHFHESFINVDTGLTATIETVLAGTEDVRKTGGGTLVMGGSTVSTYSGELSIEDGIWQMSGTGTSARMDTDIRINGGTLLVDEVTPSSNNQFGTNTNIEYEYGLLQFASANEDLGTLNLTLSTDSSIDLTGPGITSKVYFADSSAENWADSGSNLLFIENWEGVFNVGGGDDQIFFGSSASGLTTAQLQQIRFINPNGMMGTYYAIITSAGEVVPFIVIPEPATVATGSLIVILAFGHWYHRRRKRQGLAQSDSFAA